MLLRCDTFGALNKCWIDGTVVGCGLTGSIGGGAVFILAMILMVEVGLWNW